MVSFAFRIKPSVQNAAVSSSLLSVPQALNNTGVKTTPTAFADIIFFAVLSVARRMSVKQLRNAKSIVS